MTSHNQNYFDVT